MRPRDSNGKFCETGKVKYHKGYKVVYMPNHQHSRMNGYVYEHILVAEQKMGRHIQYPEVVHHIDGNKLNNSPDNIEVLSSSTDHMHRHWKERSHKYSLSTGESLTLSEIAKRANVDYMTVYQRIKKLGWTADEAITGRKTYQESIALPCAADVLGRIAKAARKRGEHSDSERRDG